MKILVVGNADQAAACREKFGPLMEYSVCATWSEANAHTEESHVVFDFGGARSNAQVSIQKEMSSALFVDASFISLREWQRRTGARVPNTYGFCGLTTFLSREVLEVILPPGGKRENLERVCRELGTPFQVVADQAGLVSPRVICMIINEAYYTLEEGTATQKDIDLAMKLGTNYPFGPFEWAERIGLQQVVNVLDAVYHETRDERYRICPLLIEQARQS